MRQREFLRQHHHIGLPQSEKNQTSRREVKVGILKCIQFSMNGRHTVVQNI